MIRFIFCFLLLGNTAFAQSGLSPELFIQIREPGRFEVAVNDEVIVSKTGKFRFYDLYNGRTFLSISAGGRTILRKEIVTRPGVRTILQFSKNSGIQTLAELPVSEYGRYALDNWNGSLDSRPDRGRPFPGRPDAFYGMNDADFDRLYSIVRKEPFDNDKGDVIMMALRGSKISVGQLSILLKTFTFDDKRLNAALNSYNAVYDPANFYRLSEVFDFNSSKDKLKDFLLKRG